MDDKMKIPQPMCKRRRLDVQNVDQSKMVDIQSLPANPLLEAQVFNKRSGLQVKVFEGNKVYVVNTGDADASIPFGAVLRGYGKGRFDRNSTRGSSTPIATPGSRSRRAMILSCMEVRRLQ